MNENGQGKRSLSDRLNEQATVQSEIVRKHATSEHKKTVQHWTTESESLRASISADLNTTKNAIQDQLKQIRNYWIWALGGVIALLTIALLGIVLLMVWKESGISESEAKLTELQGDIALARSTIHSLLNQTSGVIILNQNGKKYLVLPNEVDPKRLLKCGKNPCLELPSQ